MIEFGLKLKSNTTPIQLALLMMTNVVDVVNPQDVSNSRYFL